MCPSSSSNWHPHVALVHFRDLTARQYRLQPRADHVMLQVNVPLLVFGLLDDGVQFAETVRHPGEERELRAHALQVLVRQGPDRVVFQHPLHIGEFLVVAFFFDERGAALPELLRLDPGVTQDRLVLHVLRAQGVIEVVDDGDDVVWFGHGGDV